MAVAGERGRRAVRGALMAPGVATRRRGRRGRGDKIARAAARSARRGACTWRAPRALSLVAGRRRGMAGGEGGRCAWPRARGCCRAERGSGGASARARGRRRAGPAAWSSSGAAASRLGVTEGGCDVVRVCAGGKRAERARVRACAHSRGSRRGARPEGARGQAGEQTCARVRADGVASGRCGVRGAPNVGACARTRERSRLKARTALGAGERWRA